VHQHQEADRTDEDVIQAMDGFHLAACQAHVGLFAQIREADRRELWRSEAPTLGAWLSGRYSITWWKANRWIQAARALEQLPRISEAFETGRLGVDKVVELTRLATPETEETLIPWAQAVSGATIRRKAELATRQQVSEVREADRHRSLQWWYSPDERQFALALECPAERGPLIISAISRETEQIPVMPGEEDPVFIDARRADAFMGILSTRVASDPDPDRATVVVHVSAETLMGGGCKTSGARTGPHVTGAVPTGPQISGSWAEIESGPMIHPEVARRLCCTARIQAMIEDSTGEAIAMGRVSREPSSAMMRLLRFRDRHCQFPGCGSTRYLQAHHIRWWSSGGTTDLDKLVLLCTFHHKLVHEHGWRITRDPDGTVRWYRPDGTPYRAGPAPPREPALPREAAAAADRRRHSPADLASTGEPPGAAAPSKTRGEHASRSVDLSALDSARGVAIAPRHGGRCCCARRVRAGGSSILRCADDSARGPTHRAWRNA
jgi:uncharacterized protein DUF222/HNH endonuclease